MDMRLGLRRLAIAITWALAIATWGSIAHFFVGTPELGAALPLMVGASIGVAPLLKVVPLFAFSRRIGTAD